MPTDARLRAVFPYALAKFARRPVIDAFHTLLYRNEPMHSDRRFLGQHLNQMGLDLWTYQEIIDAERPAWILQTGVARGGSILFFARLLDLIGAPESAVVIGIDIHQDEKTRDLDHPRIRLLWGSSTDPEILAQAEALMPDPHGLVVLDSDHSKAHVTGELAAYARFCAPGCHLVVEDTNVNGHPVYPSHGDGPMEAVDEFLAQHPDFVRDDAVWQHNLVSFHAGGWLLRRPDAA